MLVDGAKRPSVAPHAYPIRACISACPAEETDVEVLDGLHLDVAYPVLLLVVVFLVLSVTVINCGLITDEPMLVLAYGKEVALQLEAEVTAILSNFTAWIVLQQSRHVLTDLRIVAHSYVPRIQGIVVSEATLELANFDLKLLETHPFMIKAVIYCPSCE